MKSESKAPAPQEPRAVPLSAARFKSDMELVDQLQAKPVIQAIDDPWALTTAGRLLIRYGLWPEIADRLAAVVKSWGMDSAELNSRTRALWASGYKPELLEPSMTGSGSDIQDDQSNS